MIETLLQPDIIASNAVGAGTVWAVMKVHLAYINARITNNEQRTARLEALHMKGEVK